MHICTGFLFLLLVSVKSASGANILFVAAVASPSHHIWNRALVFGLVKKGHNVTHIGPDEDNIPKPQNYSHILLEGVYDKLFENFNINDMTSNSPIKMSFEFQDICVHQCKLNLKSNGLQKLLSYPLNFKFDLIIVDITMGTCLYPLIQKFNYPPSIAVTAFLLPTYVSYSFGNSLFPSYIPWYGLPYSTEMNFMQRVWNYVYTYFDINLRYIKQYQEEHETAKEIFGQSIPSMQELERHITLVLANTDPILDVPQPIPPNIIPVGGLHTRPSEKLNDDLKDLLDNAKNGVILFSLGTNIRSDKLDNSTQKAIVNAFSKISQTVIWKFESEIKNLPKNVIVRKWLPQNDILGHPNVKLFIGHGGALSTQEAIFHGVPMIAIPFIVDQHVTTKMIVRKQLGVQIDFTRITSGYVLRQIREVLDNPVYYENMKKVSKMFKDRSETPLERGIFWIEYVIRHGGAEFLGTPARDQPMYISTGLDVLVFLGFIICVAMLILYKLVRLILTPFKQKKKVKIQ